MNYINTNGQAGKASRFLVGVSIWLTLCSAGTMSAQTTAFTYQGKLTDGGTPANNSYDLQFKLFDALSGGAQQGQTLTRNPVTVTVGIFTVTLDFGANAFSGAARYLEIGVRPASSGNPYIVLAPRQPITASPYAIQTLNAQQLGGLPPSRFVQTDASGSVGLGVTNPTTKLQVLQTTPGTTAIYAESATGRGVWGKSTSSKGVFGESVSLEGVQGVSTSGSGVAGVSTSGVGVLGLSASAAGVYGESAASGSLSSPGVYGKATGFDGVGVYGLSAGSLGVGLYGESTNGRGVMGKSVADNGVWGVSFHLEGVRGQSTNSSGVYGETAVSSLTAGGVYGKGWGSGSIGVIGEANVNNAVGVFGVSSSPSGFGVYARNQSGGRALFAEGNVSQDLASGGAVKAMLEVDGIGNILRCYNGINNTNSGTCGITVTLPLGPVGVFRIDFGVAVSHRFFSVTVRYLNAPNDNNNGGANYRVFNNTSVEVFTFIAGVSEDTSPRQFMIIMF